VTATSSAASENPGGGTRLERRDSFLADFLILTKARLSLMVVFTTTVGYCSGSEGTFGGVGLLLTVLGTSLTAAAAAVLNQVIEVRVDARMERTRKRPLPSNRMTVSLATAIGVALGVSGVGVLWMGSTPRAALLALATMLIYLFAYTPLKQKSAWCTGVGAVAGAIPPVIGWAGTESGDVWKAWFLFGVLFLWQIPHFLAIAWLYKEEYEGAGLVMIDRKDTEGVFTALQTVFFSLSLCALAFVPIWNAEVNFLYKAGAGISNFLILGSAFVFLTDRTRVSARRLFFSSILYLPTILLCFYFGVGMTRHIKG
jgi:protoheme IX farnesyltransferase